MAILQKIPLQAVISQTLTVFINGQTLNITIKGITVNNKTLQNNTPAYEPTDQIIGGVLVPKSSIFMMADIKLGDTPIIYNAFCSNGVYLNQFPSKMVGYLFFIRDGWKQNTDDSIIYTNFNTDTTLYYSDYDALKTNFFSFVDANRTDLQQRFLYGYTG